MILCKIFQFVVKSFKAICYFGNCQHAILNLLHCGVSFCFCFKECGIFFYPFLGYYITGPCFTEVIATFLYSSTAGVGTW
jgi:hypothetical protein